VKESRVATERVIDGSAMARNIREEIRAEADQAAAQRGRRPGLAVVLVGDNPASATYVRSKTRAAREVGFQSWTHRRDAGIATTDLLALIETLNRDDQVDGILVQLPLPTHVDTDAVLEAIDPAKDVDGLTPANLGRLVAGRPGPVPCTPRGVMVLLERSGEPVTGRRAVIIGRSRLVGLPLAILLTRAGATVTVCHTRTVNLADEVRRADVVVAAAGVPHLVQGDWVRPDAVLVDVGISRHGDRLVGDVHPDARERCRRYTPVPGGVGPMTVAMLLKNTLEAFQRR
jgi:methylenetetrahydrofolate dehydrogenase (NADP+)/methenyltetrahydrofolate cyclohydrolase